jgi:hypothetical protein
MTDATLTANTPFFVLMENKSRVGPQVDLDAPTIANQIAPLVIYGFSDKSQYRTFCENSSLALTPYPLVKFYLRDETSRNPTQLKLVVLNASGPDVPRLDAALMNDVLDAHESDRKELVPSVRLLRNDTTGHYTIDGTNG